MADLFQVPGQKSWRDWVSLDGGAARRFREVSDIAYCTNCGDVRLNTFSARANFAINATSRHGGYDRYCPACNRFYEWDHAAQCFDDITTEWMEDFESTIYCSRCTGSLRVHATDPPQYRCCICHALAPADLREIRRTSLDP